MEKVEIIDFKLLVDDRGWVAWPVAEMRLEQKQVRRLHLPCLKPGAVRGNHYHIHNIEFALVLSGPCRALFEDNETGEKQEFLIPGDSPVLFKILPNVTHAFKNENSRDIYLLCYEQNTGNNHNNDICRKTIL
jgi:dTDP-4-dehydrorhamnose 3,5-epimerase-like enzyme